MNAQRMLEEISSLMREPGKCSEDVADFLLHHKCLYLLSRIINNSNKYTKIMALNETLIQYRYSVCKNVFCRLNSIPYALIKGAVLSNSIYGKPYYRLSGDIDILISPKYIQQATAILNEEGFQQSRIIDEKVVLHSREELLYQKLFTHQLAPFQIKTEFKLCPIVTIDVNFDILWGESMRTFDVDSLLKHTETLSIYGVKISKLTTTFEFVSMCLHHYKDMNSTYLLYRKGYRFYEFLDIYYYLINRQIDADTLLMVAKEMNVVQYIYCCIYYVRELFNDQQLNKYLENLKLEEGVNLVSHFGLNSDEIHLWKYPLLERVFGTNFQQLISEHLNGRDWEKIKINTRYMAGELMD